MALHLLIIALTLLFPSPQALLSLPEVFATHPLTHPNFSTLSATTLTLHPSGDVFLVGVAHPNPPSLSNQTAAVSSRLPQYQNVILNSTSPQPFLARISKNATISHLSLLNATGQTNPVALVYHGNHLFLTGTTTGTVNNAIRTTATGTSSIFLAKLTLDGRHVWEAPLLFGSGGHDTVSALAVDPENLLPHIFIAGKVSGDLFPVAQRATLDQSAATQDDARLLARRNTPPVDNASAIYVRASEQNRRTRANSRHRDSDFFLAKVDPRTAYFEAVQLPLDRDNSADAIAIHGTKLYAAVNSYSAAPFDPEGSSALLAFDTHSLKYRTVYLPTDVQKGDYIQAMAVDGGGDLYLGGFSMRGHRISDGSYILRKYAADKGVLQWERILGNFTKVEPRVTIAVGKRLPNVYVAGHTTGLYFSEEDSSRELIKLPLTVFSSDGHEIISWDRTSLFPTGYEEIAQIVLDRDDNVLYAGRWLNPANGMYDATVGSFGASTFTARAAELDGGSSAAMNAGDEKGGMAASTIGLVCLAVGAALVIAGVAINVGRNKSLDRKGLVYGEAGESDGYDGEGTVHRIDVERSLGSDPATRSHIGDVRLGMDDHRVEGQEKGVGGSSGPV